MQFLTYRIMKIRKSTDPCMKRKVWENLKQDVATAMCMMSSVGYVRI